VVVLTRIAPPRSKGLDSDNLQRALKAVRDAVADQLGVNDGDKRVIWLYQQATGPWAVEVEVWETEI
jgi:hypothetical protein